MDNLILMTDSYKASHFKQYPPNTQAMFSYLESRGGRFDRTLFFGLQYLIKRYMSKKLTHADVDEAKAFFAAHGTPFPEAGWRKVVTQYDGYLPIRIRAVPEGLIVPVSNALLTCESLDPELFWLVTWVETFLMRLWYPITVATQSWQIRRIIRDYLHKTSDNPEAELNFKLHDFGARGVSSGESAAIGGAAHLAAGWMGSDTVEGVLLANRAYGADMAAFSIPASEHSTITSWGKDAEFDAFENMLTQFGGQGKIVACVSDSFDIYKAVRYWMSQSEKIKASGTKLVIRPDSGDPCEVVLNILDEMKSLMTRNSKGFRVLPPHFGLIQGDGVNQASIENILKAMRANGYSASNIAFGMGGALLQSVNRDTQKFAYKCSAVKVDGEWHDVYKNPVTDPGKKSKRGRLDLSGSYSDGFKTEVCQGYGVAWNSVMRLYYECGPVTGELNQSLDSIRNAANDSRVI